MDQDLTDLHITLMDLPKAELVSRIVDAVVQLSIIRREGRPGSTFLTVRKSDVGNIERVLTDEV